MEGQFICSLMEGLDDHGMFPLKHLFVEQQSPSADSGTASGQSEPDKSPDHTEQEPDSKKSNSKSNSDDSVQT